MKKSLGTAGQKSLVEALIAARKAKGISQIEMAEKLKCHQSFIARVESGQRRIDVPELVILARALDTDPQQILEQVIAAVPAD